METRKPSQPNKADPQAAPVVKPRHTLMGNPLSVFLLSALCALITWLVVTMFFDPQGFITIGDAAVNFSYNSTTYTSLGLDIVEQPEAVKVSVKVEGNGTIIGAMKASDIMVYPNYSTVKGSGETTLSLEARIINSDYINGGIKLTVEAPTTVNVIFDTVSDKVVPVTADTSQISIAEGFILNKVSPVPAEVTLHGPTSELDQVASIAAPVTANTALSDTLSISAVLELRDADGNPVTPEFTTLDNTSANVTLTVYQTRELPLVVDFIDTPNGFDASSLKYSLSYSTLRVAGPAKMVANLTELSITSFDLAQEFAFGRDYQRQIELPNNIVSQDGVSTVTLSFDTTDMDTKTLNVSNIRPINVPSNINLDVLTSLISEVRLYGPADEIAELTAGSVLAQIDCQSISVTAGQQTIPVTIQIPSSSRIFAVGSYTVQCEITAQ